MPRDVELTFPPSQEPPQDLGEAELLGHAARKLRVPRESLARASLVRVSFDARVRHRTWRVLARIWRSGEPAPAPPVTTPPTFPRPGGDAPRIAIVGSGPAGLFSALDCLAAGLNVSVFERGKDVRERRKSLQLVNRGEGVDRDSNYCFGEGGAGTYSDGKLYTRSGTKDEVRGVLETLVAHGAPLAILSSWRPHVGSNRLPDVVQALRETIVRSGGTIAFGSRVEEIETELVPWRPHDASTAERPGDPGASTRRAVRGLRARDLASDKLAFHACDALVLATGHSALDALLMARRAGAVLEPKGFAMGVRVEHPQEWVDARQYGGLRGPCELPAAFYELVSEQDGRGVYSFCMCPGGFIVPATTAEERVVVNGMSLSRRDSPFANSGLVVAIEPEDWCREAGERWGWSALMERAHALGAELGPGFASELPRVPADDALFGVRLQLALETLAAHAGGGANRAPVQRADRFAAGARSSGSDASAAPLAASTDALPSSYRPGLTPCALDEFLPRGIHERLRAALADFDAKLPGFASEHGQLVGVESRTSAPVRIARDPETLESREVAGLYPAGEGAGYAGGIVSAALDGRRIAAALARVRAG